MRLMQPVFVAGAAVFAAANARAETTANCAASERLQTSSNIALVSDYRGRGISFSDQSAALQGGFDVAEESGWSAGLWGSTLAADFDADLEIDVYAARSFAFGSTEVTLGAAAYIFPGADGWDFGEVQASASRAIGPFDTTLAVNYAWEQDGLGDEDDVYVAVQVATPIGRFAGMPLTVGGSVGYEEGAFAVEDAKLDWSLSLTGELGGVELGLSYVDTDLDGDVGRSGVVFSIARTF
jgi:uncharacterized protein (TIGR02001 family)